MQVTCSGCDRTLQLKPGKQLTDKSLCPTCGTPLLADSHSTGSWEQDDDVDRYPEPIALSPGAARALKRAGGIALVMVIFCVRGYLRIENRQRNEERRHAAAVVEHRQESARNRMLWTPPEHVTHAQSQPPHDSPAQNPTNFPNVASPHANLPNATPNLNLPENPAMEWHKKRHQQLMEQQRARFEEMRKSHPGRFASGPFHNVPQGSVTSPSVPQSEPVLTEFYDVKPIATSASDVDGVQVHPFRPFFFTRSHSTRLKTFDIESDRLIHTCDIPEEVAENGSPAGRITAMTLTPDGARLLVGTYRGAVLVYHIKEDGTLSWESTRQVQQNPVDAIAASPYGQRVLSSTSSGKVYCWNLTTGEDEWKLADIDRQVQAMHFIDNDNVWLCTGQFLARWNLTMPGARQEQEYLLDVDLGTAAVTFSPSGDEVAIGTSGMIRRFALGTGQLISKCKAGFSLYSLKYSGDGERLYAGVRGFIHVYSRDNQLTGKIELTEAGGYPQLLERCQNREAILCIPAGHNSQPLIAERQ